MATNRQTFWRQRCKLVRRLVASVAQFDMAIRKLLSELQSGSQRLDEKPIFGFRLSVYFDDVAFGGGSFAISIFIEITVNRSGSRSIETNCSAGSRHCLNI